jgi:hypothetical protein
MKEITQTISPGYPKEIVIREYNTIDEFYTYVCNTPLNETFRWTTLHSSIKASSYDTFYGTKSYDEAIELFKNGWDDGCEKIIAALKNLPKKEETTYINKTLYDIVGFQCSVARYLQGIPTNMVNKKLTPIKQKIVTLNKEVSYNCGYSSNEIMKWGAQTLRVIKLIEQLGFRVNLNICVSIYAGSHVEIVKVRIKNANERLNISKLAFPLTHTSMFRRLFFRYIETAPTITKNYLSGYGYSHDEHEIKNIFNQIGYKDEVVLPKYMDQAEMIVDELKKQNKL